MTQLTPESEAALCAWAAEDLLKLIPCETSIGHEVVGWTDSEEDHDGAKNFGRLAFTRSRDAAHEVFQAVNRMGEHVRSEFMVHVAIHTATKGFDCGQTERSAREALLLEGVETGLAVDPLEIILAAYKAVTGREWEFTAEPKEAPAHE